MVGGGRCGGDSREGGELCTQVYMKDQVSTNFPVLACAELSLLLHHDDVMLQKLHYIM